MEPIPDHYFPTVYSTHIHRVYLEMYCIRVGVRPSRSVTEGPVDTRGLEEVMELSVSLTVHISVSLLKKERKRMEMNSLQPLVKCQRAQAVSGDNEGPSHLLIEIQ